MIIVIVILGISQSNSCSLGNEGLGPECLGVVRRIPFPTTPKGVRAADFLDWAPATFGGVQI